MKELVYHQRIRDIKARHRSPNLEALSHMDWNGVVEFLYLNNCSHLKFQFLQYLWGLWHNGQISADVVLFEFSNERVHANISCTFLDMLSPEDFINSDHRIEFRTADLVPDLQIAFTGHFREFISEVATEAQGRNYVVEVRTEKEHYRVIIQQEIPQEFRSLLHPRETTVVTVVPMISLLTTQSNVLLPDSRVEPQSSLPKSEPIRVEPSPVPERDTRVLPPSAQHMTEPDAKSDRESDRDREPHEAATFNFPFPLMSVSSDGWNAEQVVKSVIGDLAPGELVQDYIEFASNELRSTYDQIRELMNRMNSADQPSHLVLAMQLVQSELHHRLSLLGVEVAQ